VVRLHLVELSPAAARQLRKLDRPIQRRLYLRLRSLASDPRPPGCVQLQGTAGTFYRIREGTYRIIYTIEDARLVVLVVRIAHRRDVYR
jgi:mRNA interferase RelE/StbE